MRFFAPILRVSAPPVSALVSSLPACATLLLSGTTMLAACAPPRVDRAGLVAAVPGLAATHSDARFARQHATLDVFNGERRVAIHVPTPDGMVRHDDGPLPVACTPKGCAFDGEVRAGTYDVTLTVYADDLCGQTAPVSVHSATRVRFAGGTLSKIAFDDVTYPDENADDVPNLMAMYGCSAVNAAFSTASPDACAGAHPCCDAWPVNTAERAPMQAFPATSVNAVDAAGNVAPHDVPSFALDAHEATRGQFLRCVAAGACQLGQPDTPARAQLDPLEALDSPITTLSPEDAEALCAFMGKRLPTDAEWQVAAGTARYPWGDEAPRGCTPDSTPGANHASQGRVCAKAVVPVGQYAPASGLWDMAGNAAEWTVVAAREERTAVLAAWATADAPTMRLRGGHFAAGPALLDNALFVGVRAADWEGHVRRDIAGVRCAADDPVTPAATEMCAE